jgi:hypothetical protein
MARLFFATACVFLLVVGSFADKEYEAHGHDHHHHHAHDGRKFIDLKSFYTKSNSFQMIIMIMNRTDNYLPVFIKSCKFLNKI